MVGPIRAVQTEVVAQAAAGLQTHAVSSTRKNIALGIAAVADLIQLGLFPFFAEGAISIPDDVLDVVVAIALFVTLGFKPRILAALALELIPGVALFPSWTTVVATIPSVSKPKKLPAPKQAPKELDAALPETDSYSG
ncbi:MAG TPA: hypothetical protein VGH28_11330 [Polyangiaceae bacterium]|jgi:hypothetical protein